LVLCGRWLNQLKPELKRGPFSVEEEAELIRLHHKDGNEWALIAKCLPGRARPHSLTPAAPRRRPYLLNSACVK